MEIEAKLRTRTRRTLEAIGARRSLGSYRLRPVAVRTLQTIYLDTPQHDLLRAGIALRLRRARGKVEVTIKLPGSVAGAVHRRPETTWSLRRMPKLPLELGRRGLRERIERYTAGRPLVPLVGTRIRRRAILVTRMEGTAPIAEIDCDDVAYFRPTPKGIVHSRGTDLEIEVELLGGRETDLQAIVRELRTSYRLQPARGSKLGRALAWAKIRRR